MNNTEYQSKHMDDTCTYVNDLPKDDKDLFNLDDYPLLNTNHAIKILGSEAQYRTLLKFMLDQGILEKDVEEMKLAYQEPNWDKVQKLAHKMKSGALYIGADKMKMACQYLERYWKVGRRRDLEKLYQQLLDVIGETEELMRNWLLNH